MKIELPSLDSEPILYFLLHSGVFVGSISLLFFALGICMGATIWGRYKKQLALARVEIHHQLEELAMVKRRLAEQTVRPATMPLSASVPSMEVPAPADSPPSSPAPVLATASEPPAPSLSALASPVWVPAAPAPPPEPVLPEPASTSPSLPVPSLAPQEKAALGPALPRLELPELQATASVEPPAPLITGGLALGEHSQPRRPIIRARRRTLMPPPSSLVTEPPGAASEPASAVEPFGFLLGGNAQESEPAVPLSALAAIVKGRAPAPDLLPPMPEMESAPAAPPDANTPPALDPALAAQLLPEPVEIRPPVEPILPVSLVLDPDLGLIYRQRPPDADDLTLIRGVSAALASRLNELGVHTFRQIAAWDENQVREFSQRLSFKDRIAREQWIEQARSLNEARSLILDGASFTPSLV